MRETESERQMRLAGAFGIKLINGNCNLFFFSPHERAFFFLFDVSIFTWRAAVALINEIVLINFTSHVAETTAAKKCGEELDDPLTNIS